MSKRERDMVLKNSELSFRVRTLEETISQLKKDKSKLVMIIHLMSSMRSSLISSAAISTK